MKSKFGTVNIRDIAKGFVVAFVAATLTGLAQTLEAQTLPSIEAIKAHATIGLIAGISYVVKNILENSKGQILKKDQK